MVEPLRLICAPWATVDDLPTGGDRPVELDDAAWTDLLWQSSEILYSFSGRQFSGGCASTVILDRLPGGTGYCAAWTPMGVDAATAVSGARPVRWARDQIVAVLPGSPVTSVQSVTIAGTPVDFEVRPASGQIWRADRRPWPLDGTAAITYRHGLAPDAGGRRAAVLLALELGKAGAGLDSDLPRRISSITREGVSIGMLDTFDHLDKSQTGILEIDMWLAAVNPARLRRRPSVVSVDMPRTYRRIS